MLLAAGLCLAAPVLAQTAPSREELTPQRSRDLTSAQPSRLTVEDEVERAPCPLDDPAYAAVTVNFSGVDLGSFDAVPSTELAPAWQDLAGRDLPVGGLCEVRDRIATHLRRLGYIAAVQVPPQRIEKGGKVHLDILLARLVSVRVRGEAGNSQSVLEAYLGRLTERPYFNSREAERDLLLARDLPGYDVRLVLRPAGTKPGEVIGDVEVRRQRAELVFSAQNLGSRAVGEFGGFLQLTLNDLTGLGDSTRIGLFNTSDTREQTVLQLGHDFAIGGHGLRLGGEFLHAWTRPSIPGVNIQSRSMVGSLRLTYPFTLSRHLALRGAAGFDIIEQKVDIGALPLSRDRLRVGYLRLDLDALDDQSLSGGMGYSASEPRWRMGGSLELRKGISGLGASPVCSNTPVSCTGSNVPTSRLDGDAAAFAARASARIDFRPDPGILFTLAPRAQIADRAQLSYEQFSAGNYTVGRGYDPGTIQGDNGFGLTAEIGLGKATPHSADDLTLQPFVFYDAAWTWTKGATTGGNNQHLQSTGFGVRSVWGNHARFDVTVAVPLETAGTQTSIGSTRLLFTLSTRLFPW